MTKPQTAAPAPTPGDRLELMQTFVRIVEAGSLSAAAAQLHTTQPTVSRRLQALERSLGVRLLQRTTHTIKLTEDGERCFAGARELLTSWQALESGLRGVDDEPTGNLRVVAPHAFGQQQLIAPLARYLQRYSGVTVEWLLHDSTPDFIGQGIDCAIRVGEVNDPSFVAIKLAKVPRIAVAAPSLQGAAAFADDDVDPAAMSGLPWLALQTFYRSQITLTHDDGQTCQLNFQPRMATDSLYAIRSAAIAGLGVGIVSAWAVADDIAQGRLLHMAPRWHASPLPMYVIYPHASFYPARLRRFVETMRTAVPEAVGGLISTPDALLGRN